MNKYERLGESINKKVAFIEAENLRRLMEATAETPGSESSERQPEAFKKELLVAQNHPVVMRETLRILNEINGEVFDNRAIVMGWKKTEDPRSTSYNQFHNGKNGTAWRNNHDYQGVYEECKIFNMPLDKCVTLRFKIGERHWHNGSVDYKKTRNFSLAEQQYLEIVNAVNTKSINLAQPVDDVLESLNEGIIDAIENSYNDG
jgi:hypothetical protein